MSTFALQNTGLECSFHGLKSTLKTTARVATDTIPGTAVVSKCKGREMYLLLVFMSNELFNGKGELR